MQLPIRNIDFESKKDNSYDCFSAYCTFKHLMNHSNTVVFLKYIQIFFH